MDKHKELNRLFEQAKNERKHQSFEETKQQFLHSLNSHSEQSWIKKLFTFKKLLIMTTILLSIVLGINLFVNNTSEKNVSNNQHLIKNKTVVSSDTTRNNIAEETTHSNETDLDIITNKEEISLKQVKKKHTNSFHFSKLELLSPNLKAIHPNDLLIKSGSLTKIPILTKDQIKENEKQKAKMLKALSKLKSEDYVFILAGTMFYEGSEKSFQAFYLQTTEVSNLEYRTFLNDLIIQKRFEEYEIAKVDSSKWVELYGGNKIYSSTKKSKNNWNDSIYKNLHFMSNYFNHPAYNNYPVCNISRAGAELYCTWLQEEFKKVYTFKNEERYENLIRIPSRAEWCYAASNQKDNQVYPWGIDSITNSKGEFLVNKKSIPLLESKNNTPIIKNENNDVLNGVSLNNIVLGFPQNIYQFKQTPNGIYNLSGNIAEMVYEDYNSKTRCGTAGGSWESNAEEIKIFGPDPYAGITTPHPAIGFRICFTYRKWL